MFTQLNPPLISMLITSNTKVCLSFEQWIDNHHQVFYPSLVKQHKGHSTVAVFFPLIYKRFFFFFYFFYLTHLYFILHYYISKTYPAFALTQGPCKKNQTLILATVLSSLQTAVLITSISNPGVYSCCNFSHSISSSLYNPTRQSI